MKEQYAGIPKGFCGAGDPDQLFEEGSSPLKWKLEIPVDSRV